MICRVINSFVFIFVNIYVYIFVFAFVLKFKIIACVLSCFSAHWLSGCMVGSHCRRESNPALQGLLPFILQCPTAWITALRYKCLLASYIFTLAFEQNWLFSCLLETLNNECNSSWSLNGIDSIPGIDAINKVVRFKTWTSIRWKFVATAEEAKRLKLSEM